MRALLALQSVLINLEYAVADPFGRIPAAIGKPISRWALAPGTGPHAVSSGSTSLGVANFLSRC